MGGGSLSHALLVFIFNAVGVVAVVLYLISIRYIGVPWARLQWKMWATELKAWGTYPVLRFVVFPGTSLVTHNFGEKILTRWTRSPKTWFAPMAAIAVSQFNETGTETRPARFLQVQAIFWLPTLLWSGAWMICCFGVYLARAVAGKILNIVLYFPRRGMRALTKTRERDLVDLCLQPRVPRDSTT